MKRERGNVVYLRVRPADVSMQGALSRNGEHLEPRRGERKSDDGKEKRHQETDRNMVGNYEGRNKAVSFRWAEGNYIRERMWGLLSHSNGGGVE